MQMANPDLYEKINQSSPSDEIILNGESMQSFVNLWTGGRDTDDACPSDIFLNNTIPLKDCIIRYEELELSTTRISVCEDSAYLIRDFEYEKNHMTMVQSILVNEGEDFVSLGPFEITNCPEKIASKVMAMPDFLEMEQKLNIASLKTWYGIQISLLNPILKEGISEGRKVKYDGACCGKKKVLRNGKRKTHYVKRHIIKKFDIIDILSKNKTFERKTFCWYVIGHWRTNKNGKKSFVVLRR